jgi:hypothetical protein
MEGEGSIWGLLLFVLVAVGLAAWKTGAVAKLRANIRDAANRK